MKERFALISDTARRMAHYAIDAAPAGCICEIKERTRTADQNAALHAMLQDIARQKKRSVEDWKALMELIERTRLEVETE